MAALCIDRAAIERVYHAHRLGTKRPFKEVMPSGLIAKNVQLDLRKEAVLRQHYGVEITSAMIAAEVQRIDSTTRAPAMLAEIKTALGDDPERFARAFAGPIVVERLLRAKFDNEDKLHAPRRREAEAARKRLLAGKPVEGLREVTWQLTPRPAGEAPEPPAIPPPSEGEAESASYTNEATAQRARVLSPPEVSPEEEQKLYFEDLHPELQKVLQVQLREPGDVSAVIEMPGGFLVFVAKERTAEILRAASLSLPKRSYERWLEAQEIESQKENSP